MLLLGGEGRGGVQAGTLGASNRGKSRLDARAKHATVRQAVNYFARPRLEEVGMQHTVYKILTGRRAMEGLAREARHGVIGGHVLDLF